MKPLPRSRGLWRVIANGITIVDLLAFGARPFADSEGHLGHDVTAVMATFAGGVERVDLDDRSPVPDRLVFQLPDEFSPAHVGKWTSPNDDF